MRSWNPPNYQYDAEGKLVVPNAETEEQQLIAEAAVLQKEGLSTNSVADVAAQFAPEDEGGEEGETDLSLTSIDPTEAQIGDADLTLTCTGTGFGEDAVIVFNGGEEPTEVVDENTCTTTVKPSTVGTAGSYDVMVRSGGYESAPQQFTFTEEGAPVSTESRAARRGDRRSDRR